MRLVDTQVLEKPRRRLSTSRLPAFKPQPPNRLQSSTYTIAIYYYSARTVICPNILTLLSPGKLSWAIGIPVRASSPVVVYRTRWFRIIRMASVVKDTTKTSQSLRKAANDIKRGVALTGRNTTGPPWTVGRPTARRPALLLAGSVTDDDRRQRATQYWPIRRASNNCG